MKSEENVAAALLLFELRIYLKRGFGFPLGGSCRPRATDEGMLEQMNVLDRLSRANTPHPSADADTFPQGEGLSLSNTYKNL
ncbi:MAG: hypothetical protein ACI4RP_03905 [Acutalibacteraceae bacterium]